MSIKPDKAVKIKESPEPIISEPLIENPNSLHEITKEERDKIKGKDKKAQIAMIYAPEPIALTPLSAKETEKVRKLKEKNKKKPAPIYL